MSLIEIVVPSVGESVTEVTLAQWLKPDGSIVKRDEVLCEFESEKATLELVAESGGKLVHVAKAGDDLKIGALVARIDTSAAADTSAPAAAPSAAAPVAAAATPTASTPSTSYAAGTPSPSAAKIMAENGISPDQVNGTGKDARITKEDAMKAAAGSVSAPAAPAPAAPVAPATPVASAPAVVLGTRHERRSKMSRLRRTIAARLVSAKNNTAMLTTFNEVDMSGIMKLREQYQDRFVKKHGIKLGFMSLFVKACTKALMEMPDVNASLAGDEIVYHDFVDMSIAVSTPTGLVVPSIRNAEMLDFAGIEKAIKVLAEKARDNKLSMEEMTGGTFTITNGGVFGSLLSTPILNEPQSAILGMHAIKERPIVVNGQIEIRPMMYLALSYDHRIIDGSTSVTFLVKVKNYLEDPTSLLMDV